MSTTIWDIEPAAHPPTYDPASTHESSTVTPEQPTDAWPSRDTPLPPTPPPSAPPTGPPTAKKRGNGKIIAVIAGAAALVGAGFIGRDLVTNTGASNQPVSSSAGAAAPSGQGVEQVA